MIFQHPTRTLWGLVLLATVLGTTPNARALTDKTDTELHLRYQAMWGGLHIADFTLSMFNGGGTYENRFRLETRGVTRFFTNVGVQAKSKGRIVQSPQTENTDTTPLGAVYQANHYRTEYTNKKHFRWVDISFPQTPEPAKAVTGTSPIPGREDNWNPKEKGPEELDRVEAEHRIGVNDPITLIPQMMAVVRGHMAGGPKTGVIKGFDGRRRFDMHVTYLGPMTRTVGNTHHETYRVRIDPKPVAGFKKRHKALWNGSAYDFYLSRDGKFVPLQIVPVKHGPVLTLVTQCQSECVLKPEED